MIKILNRWLLKESPKSANETGVEVVNHCCYHCGAGKDDYDVPVVVFGAAGSVRQGLCRDCVELIGSYIL